MSVHAMLLLFIGNTFFFFLIFFYFPSQKEPNTTLQSFNVTISLGLVQIPSTIGYAYFGL